jgi:biotin carboxyl carrier protein
MSDDRDDLQRIELAAREIVPRLTERLNRFHLGELEVRQGSLRVRVAAANSPAKPGHAPAEAEAAPTARRVQPAAAPATSSGAHGVASPAVGYFGFADGLGPGMRVEKGDALGHVDMLGVRHDVRAPRKGVVSHLVAEAGEPVEYGQVLVELEPAE